MGSFSNVLLTLSWAITSVICAETSDDMGPAAFLWPPDREWTADKDNSAPCGSPARVSNRTEFPMTDGHIALVDQDEGYNVQLSVSYSNDPSSNDDFDVLIPSQNFKDLLNGHTCVPVSDPPGGTAAGANATFQIMYTADFDKSENQTFYACADITYVDTAPEAAKLYCFNATRPSADDPASTSHPASGSTSDAAGSSSGLEGLSAGGIAGAVVGSVVGALLIAGAGLWFYRRRQRDERTARMSKSSRVVPWVRGPRAADRGKDSESQDSVRMQNLGN